MNKEHIISEANGCYGCVNKNCRQGCPLSNDITVAIKYVKDGKYKEAYEEFSKTTVLLPICGRICPHQRQCEGKCIKGMKGKSVEIGNIEAFLGDYSIENGLDIKMFPEHKRINKKVAVIGSGPAGITCAATLKRLGVEEVTIFEKYSKLGGLLVHGIPEFRLSPELVEKTYSRIIDLGIDVKYNVSLQKDILISEIQEEYDAIFLGIGANISSKMNIPGEDINGVYGGNELLEYRNIPKLDGKKIAIIGGGNVAMDVSRTLKKRGASSVKVIYRRSREQMPAENKEIKEAINEGIEFVFNTNVIQIVGQDHVKKIECIKTKLIEENGKRPYPVNIDNSNYYEDVDIVVMAVGSKLDKYLVDTIGLKYNSFGYVNIDEKYKTSLDKVYAGGDLVGEKATIASASASGREAAKSIYKELSGGK